MDTSKESLEQLLHEFADKICDRYGIHFVNSGYRVHLEDEMVPDFLLISGNPVVIKIHMRVFADGLLSRNMIVVKHTLQRALELGSKKMVHTLSQNPISPVIYKNLDEKTWHKHKSSDGLLPTLLPLSRLTFSTRLQVTVVDKMSGESWTESGYAHRVKVEELERRAHANLSKLVLGDSNENQG